MKEIGGYIEIESYHLPMLHEDAIKLNCGRNAFAYIVDTKNIKKILMPRFMCDSCNRILDEYHVDVRYYSIGTDFKPIEVEAGKDEWIYLVNYYGQLTNNDISVFGRNVIVDNTQAYFQAPVEGVDTFYSCRKYFGVSDGAILYTDKVIEDLPQDESFERMRFLLGRYERSAEEFYLEYVDNNLLFETESIKRMSKLTENLLHGINYEKICKKRTKNFEYLHSRLKLKNRLNLSVPRGAFMYPLWIENGRSIRKKLQKVKIYIPMLWPNVLEVCDENTIEYQFAMDILPIPIDQRYDLSDMDYIVKGIEKCIV